MSIKEFYKEFVSIAGPSRLFDAFRRMGRLQTRALLSDDDEAAGWPEWPRIAAEDLRMKKA